MLRFEEWEARLFDSVAALSLTAGGATAAAYDGAKPALIASGQELAERTALNLESAIQYIWKYGREVPADAAQILAFMHAVAEHVSRGLLPEPHVLLRTWSTNAKYPQQVAPEHISREMIRLAEKVARIFAEGMRDPVRVAARVERTIDWRIHPYADGCGRTAKLLGAWILLRAGIRPAKFDDREEYYRAMNGDNRWWYEYYCRHVNQ